MSPRNRMLIAGTLILIVLKLFVFRASAQQSDGAGTAKMFGEVRLATDSIEHGMTQTDHSFALQTGVGYQWPIYKLGIWGSNVKYPRSDANLNLRAFGSFKLLFTANADVTVRGDLNQYYKSGERNGMIISTDFRFYDYHVLYENNSNWEGQEAAGSRFGFMTEWKIPYDLILGVNAGYNMLEVEDFSNYFDLLTQLRYRWGDLIYSLGNSYNSGSGELGERADLAFFFSIGAKF